MGIIGRGNGKAAAKHPDRIISSAFPDEPVLSSDEVRRPYECDGLTVHRQLLMLVVLPETVRQVQQILQICSEHDVPVVARGRYGVFRWHCHLLKDGVLLSLARFNLILDVDLNNRTARGATWRSQSRHIRSRTLLLLPILAACNI